MVGWSQLPLAFNPNGLPLENLTSLTIWPILVINEPVYIGLGQHNQADQNLNYRFLQKRSMTITNQATHCLYRKEFMVCWISGI